MNLKLTSEQAAGIVAGAAFIGSAGHIMGVVSETNPWFVAPVYAIGIDGLLYVGIKALGSGRKLAGLAAIVIGAIYSLAFNAHAENALTMPKLMVASSLPVCMIAAFIIEGTAKKAKKIEAPAAAPQIITKTVAPALLPIVPFEKPAPVALPAAPRWIGAGSRITLPIVPLHAPKPVRVKATIEEPKRVETPKPKAAIEGRKTGAGRVASWDVEKAVRLIEDGRTNDEVASLVGTNAKAIQRTRRVLGTDGTDAEVATVCGLSAAHVRRVRDAAKKG